MDPISMLGMGESTEKVRQHILGKSINFLRHKQKEMDFFGHNSSIFSHFLKLQKRKG